MINPNLILNDVKTLAIVCNQWGDTGKGKFVDLYADWASIIARGTGGNNAGHTIVLNDQEHIFHLVPSGILKDKEGKINVMGSGMVDDLGVLVEELDTLEENGYSYDGLRISEKANLILPYHKQLDGTQSSMKKGKIGTTGRGIGPAYADKVARFGIEVGDLRDKDRFVDKLKKVQKEHHFYLNLDIDQIVEEQLKHYQRIKDFVRDTDTLLRDAKKNGQRILLEGAQGLLLSIIYGTKPYVTSSDPSRLGLAQGVGLLPEDIDLTLGIVKFPFMTRVGNGPFPTEYGGRKSEEYCAQDNGIAHKKSVEEKEFANMGDLTNHSDYFMKGVGIRLAANEYGATTQRPRRVGRTDLVALKHAMWVNGPNLILTKADCMVGVEEIELGVAYENGTGKQTTGINHGEDIDYGQKGVYQKFGPWNEDFQNCRVYDQLPGNVQEPIDFLTEQLGARVRIVSVGPEAEQTIIKG